jgi:hypothetical protein
VSYRHGGPGRGRGAGERSSTSSHATWTGSHTSSRPRIGPDAQLGIQALDYWAWAEAHRAELAESIDADSYRPFELDIGLGLSTKRVLHPAAAATLQGLHTSISWRCQLVGSWDTVAQPGQLLVPEAEPLPPRVLPPEP